MLSPGSSYSFVHPPEAGPWPGQPIGATGFEAMHTGIDSIYGISLESAPLQY